MTNASVLNQFLRSIGASWSLLQDDGHVLHTFYGFNSDLGDVSKAAEYRTNAYRPSYMLPAASLNRWKSLPLHARTDARLRELHKNH